MSQPLVSDELWSIIEPLLPPEPAKPKGGRPRVPDRAALTGILFVLHTGLPWEMLPQEMGCGSGVTCWRHLHIQRRGSTMVFWLTDEEPPKRNQAPGRPPTHTGARGNGRRR